MWNVRFVKDYLLHRLKAKNRHGLHSPFVYRLVDNAFYDFRAKKVYPEIEIIRNKLLKQGVLTKKQLNMPKIDQLFYRLVDDLTPANIVELGEVNIITRQYLQSAAPSANVYTEVTAATEKLDFILINTDQNQQLLKYFEECLPKVNESAMLVVNGIYQNEGIKQAWAAIKVNPNVTVTIDLFWIGLVFFRKGQAWEDFFIKF